MAIWSEHVSYFGSPAAYAKAIKEKESKGQSLSDAAAAAAFKQAHPEYFGGGNAGASSSNLAAATGAKAGTVPGGTGAADRTRQLANLKLTYETQKAAGAGSDVLSSISQQASQLRQLGASEAEANKLVYGQESGWYQGWTPPASTQTPGNLADLTRQLANLKLTYETAKIGGASPDTLTAISRQADVLRQMGASEAEANKLVYGQETGWYQGWAPPQPQQPQMQYGAQPQAQPTEQLQAIIAPYVNELQRISQGVDAETAPIIYQAYDQIMGMINNAEQSLVQRFTELGQGVDPATQAALASLKQTVQRQRENLMEEMSRRGLLQSGIWLEMEDRLNQGLLTEQQKLLANRLSDLQNQLNQALMNLGQARIQAASSLGTAQIQAAESAAQRRQKALSDLISAAQEAQKQILEQQQKERELAWEREKALLPWTMGPTPAQLLPYERPTASALLPYELGPTPAEQAEIASRAFRDALAEAGVTGYYQGMPTWEREYGSRSLAQRAAEAKMQAASREKLSDTEAKNLTRGQYATSIKNEIDAEWKRGGWEGAVRALPDIEAKIWADAPELMKAGMTYNDIISMVNYARSLVGGVTPYSLTPEW